jgi:hypothetical protein
LRTLREFLGLLERFNYEYRYSRDVSVWRAGRMQDKEIQTICDLNKYFNRVYEAWEIQKLKPKTEESAWSYIDTLAQIAAEANKMQRFYDHEQPSITTPPAAVSTPEPEPVNDMGSLHDYVQFTAGKDYLKDPLEARKYLVARPKALGELYKEIRWKPTVMDYVVECNLHSFTIRKHLLISVPTFNTINNGVINRTYDDECCLLAYLLVMLY